MYDLIVVGLGAVGAATAYQAAKRGAKVLGIDQYSPPHAMGSSHGDTRITRVAIGEGEHYVPLVRRSHQIWRDIEAATGEELLVVTGGLIISGPARLATTHVPDFFDRTLAAARRFSVEHEMLGAADLRPEACVAAQLALAARHGASLACNERVLDLAEEGGVVRVRTAASEYRGRELVIAAGAWLPEFLGPEAAPLFTVTRQVLYWFEVEAPIEEYEAPAFPIWIWELQDRRHVIYGFPAIDGAGGGVKIATEQYERATTLASVDREVGDAEKRAMYQELVLPYLPWVGPRCIKAESCLYTATPDFQFVIDHHPRLAHVTIASPCSGHGFKHSAAVGEALAELALEGESGLDLAPFGLARFRNV
ncbi:MAG: FAD-dependent oxidoreductase [Usitatibacter sp.]